MTDHAVERLTELRERQRVGGRAVEDEIDIAIGLEEFADAIAYPRRPTVFAVGWYFLYVRLFQCCPSLWADRRGVIAGKLITPGPGIHFACLLREFWFSINHDHKHLQELRPSSCPAFGICLLATLATKEIA